jgi:hypothetical protein
MRVEDYALVYVSDTVFVFLNIYSGSHYVSDIRSYFIIINEAVRNGMCDDKKGQIDRMTEQQLLFPQTNFCNHKKVCASMILA